MKSYQKLSIILRFSNGFDNCWCPNFRTFVRPTCNNGGASLQGSGCITKVYHVVSLTKVLCGSRENEGKGGKVYFFV